MTAAIALAALLVVTVAAITLDSPEPVLAVAAAGVLAVVAAHFRGRREPLSEKGPEQVAAAPADGDAGASREQLEAMLSGVADAVTAQAPDGRLLYANEAAVRTLGFDSREALLAAAPAELLDAYEIFDEAGRPYPITELPGRRALAGEEAPQAIVRFRVRATGEERWSAVKANPIRDSDGRVSMAINVIEDITPTSALSWRSASWRAAATC